MTSIADPTEDGNLAKLGSPEVVPAAPIGLSEEGTEDEEEGADGGKEAVEPPDELTNGGYSDGTDVDSSFPKDKSCAQGFGDAMAGVGGTEGNFTEEAVFDASAGGISVGADAFSGVSSDKEDILARERDSFRLFFGANAERGR